LKGFELSLTLNICLPSWQWLRHIAKINDMRSNVGLGGLFSQIHQWNIARISDNNLHELALNLSIENVHDLKTIIHASIIKTSIKQPEVIVDQLLFLAIGAIQIEIQSGSRDAWQLVNRTIQNIAKPKKDLPVVWLSFMTALFALSTYIVINTNTKPHTIVPSTSLEIATSSTADPVTISMLVLTYQKMKEGNCQLPQAAMLPPEQRHAFLSFVNAGSVDIQHVEDLRLALGYVNCLYPQELMHPTPT
jgi:hypothetical protein